VAERPRELLSHRFRSKQITCNGVQFVFSSAQTQGRTRGAGLCAISLMPTELVGMASLPAHTKTKYYLKVFKGYRVLYENDAFTVDPSPPPGTVHTLVATVRCAYRPAQPERLGFARFPAARAERSGASPPHRRARGWAHTPCRHLKNQSCCCLGSVSKVAAFQTLI
jgi:hypothetical protein